MANGNGKNARNVKKDDNEANLKAQLEASHNEVKALGELSQHAKGAKARVVSVFQRDCESKLATVAMVDTYVNWYCEGMIAAGGKALVGKGLSVMKSQLAAFGSLDVIAVMPTIDAQLNQLIGAGDKAVKRDFTGKDKFGQRYAIANKVRADIAAGTTPIINAEYVKAAVAPVVKLDSAIVDAAKAAILEQTKNLLEKIEQTPALVKARDEFFKLAGIVMPVVAEKK